MTVLLTGVGELTTNDPDLGRLRDAAVVFDERSILWVGPADRAPAADTMVDVAGRAVLPGWVDAHTHLVFQGSRAAEFEARMAGRRYSAGGIGQTVAATRAASERELRAHATRLRREAELQGTTFLETKTGYGLDIDTERRCAQVAAAVADRVTYLGAHVVPAGSDRREYVDLVTGPMLQAVRPYVHAVDVFCEEGAFSVEESREVLQAGADAGLDLHVHGNQLGPSGGVGLAVEMGALSVDHCNHLDDRDIDSIAASNTIAVFLPACDLSTREPFGPARRILDAGGAVALASNCNPGSSFTTSMPFCVATAVLQMQLTVEQAVFAATRGGALALGAASSSPAGTIAVGARPDLQVLDAPSVAHLAYRPGVPMTWAVWRAGRQVVEPRPEGDGSTFTAGAA
ncbi:imidazolonepropionase [Nakamurella leprariae]|uniref:Imidazolonepropionase n=1 Tax=Nakamurella leprariae TaxID=2803911 RepID=A0A938YG19_9ACTN|nr:imidazolonepropionase [Nakamurella leprariae]MBM9467474.1 imidazolonepropionase [Nakamurella leprariae]